MGHRFFSLGPPLYFAILRGPGAPLWNGGPLFFLGGPLKGGPLIFEGGAFNLYNILIFEGVSVGQYLNRSLIVITLVLINWSKYLSLTYIDIVTRNVFWHNQFWGWYLSVLKSYEFFFMQTEMREDCVQSIFLLGCSGLPICFKIKGPGPFITREGPFFLGGAFF